MGAMAVTTMLWPLVGDSMLGSAVVSAFLNSTWGTDHRAQHAQHAQHVQYVPMSQKQRTRGKHREHVAELALKLAQGTWFGTLVVPCTL